jgi:hypothetical protein
VSRLTRREKAVVLGAPTLLAVTFLVGEFAHGDVWMAAFAAYGVIAIGFGVWLWRRSGDRSNDNNERFQ